MIGIDPPPYDPTDWYWIVAGDESRVWSSKASAYVPVSDATFQAWLDHGGIPSRIASEQELADVLRPYGLFGPVLPQGFTVSMFQARAVLLQAGPYETVDAAMQQAGGVNLIAWEYATEVRRDSPMVQAMAQQLGLTDEQVDDLFRQASAIVA